MIGAIILSTFKCLLICYKIYSLLLLLKLSSIIRPILYIVPFNTILSILKHSTILNSDLNAILKRIILYLIKPI